MREILGLFKAKQPWAACVLFVAFPFAVLCAQGSPQQQGPAYKPKPGDFTIICTLFNHDRTPPGVLLPDIPITYDPHILIGARVEKVTFGRSPWKPGSILRFLIHSPSLMLGGYGFTGKQYAMTFSPFHPRTKRELIWFDPQTRYILQALNELMQEPAVRRSSVLQGHFLVEHCLRLGSRFRELT